MQVIKNAEFGGERPLYVSRDLRLENITIHPGESALKECARIEAYGCEFRGKYPFCPDRFLCLPDKRHRHHSDRHQLQKGCSRSSDRRKGM